MEGGRLHVTDVALHAGDSKRNLAVESPECLGDGVAFDAVPDPGARRVGFDIVEVQGSASGPGAGRAHQLALTVTGRRGDVTARSQAPTPVGGAGGVDRGRLAHGVDGITIPFGCRQGLYGKDECAFGAHVSVGLRVEGMALAVRAADPHEVEAAAHPAAAEIGDGSHQRLIAIAVLKRMHRRVKSTQAGGTGRAIGHRRHHQVEVIGDPIGQHREADTGNGVLGDAVLRAPIGSSGDLCADEDPGRAVAQGMEVPAHPLDGLPCAGRQHPYLRLSLPQFVVRHSEECVVEEQLFAVPNQSLVRARQTPRSRDRHPGQDRYTDDTQSLPIPSRCHVRRNF